MVPVLLKTAIGGRSVVWRSQPVGFLLGTFSAGRRRLLEELHSHVRQPLEWTDYKMATSLFHFIASRYFSFWRSETHYGPCNFLKVQKQMKTQIPFQSHNQLLVETIQLATFLTCISDSTTFSKTRTEPSNGYFIDLSQSQQMGNFDITRTNLLLGRILPHRTRSVPFGPWKALLNKFKMLCSGDWGDGSVCKLLAMQAQKKANTHVKTWVHRHVQHWEGRDWGSVGLVGWPASLKHQLKSAMFSGREVR